MPLPSPPAHSVPESSALAPWPRLVADIGGTNVRFALIAHSGAVPSALRSLRCADFAGPREALQAWLAGWAGNALFERAMVKLRHGALGTHRIT